MDHTVKVREWKLTKSESEVYSQITSLPLNYSIPWNFISTVTDFLAKTVSERDHRKLKLKRQTKESRVFLRAVKEP